MLGAHKRDEGKSKIKYAHLYTPRLLTEHIFVL